MPKNNNKKKDILSYQKNIKEPLTPTIENETTDEVKKSNIQAYTTTHPLNMRSGASLQNPVITVIPKNDEVIYEGYHIGDWYYVKYKDYIGFCLKTFLK